MQVADVAHGCAWERSESDIQILRENGAKCCYPVGPLSNGRRVGLKALMETRSPVSLTFPAVCAHSLAVPS